MGYDHVRFTLRCSQLAASPSKRRRSLPQLAALDMSADPKRAVLDEEEDGPSPYSKRARLDTRKPVALLTGALGGIGSATATVLRDAGFEVIATDRSVQLRSVLLRCLVCWVSGRRPSRLPVFSPCLRRRPAVCSSAALLGFDSNRCVSLLQSWQPWQPSKYPGRSIVRPSLTLCRSQLRRQVRRAALLPV